VKDIYYPFINHVLEFFFSNKLKVFNNKIQTFVFPNQFIFLKGKKHNCDIIEIILRLNFNLVIGGKK